jgi:flagellar FliL protein
MSDIIETPNTPAKKKGGTMKKMVLFVVAPLVLIGGGAGAGLYAAGSKAHGLADDPNRPKLMLKEGETGKPASGPEPAHIDPALYMSTYLPIEQPFTSNLRDTDGFLQLGLGVSTYYDHRVLDNLKRADMPVRSAVLEVLSQQEAEVINTPEGKDMLRRRLRDAINKVLTEHEGFGGIDGVYFTSFIIQ